MASASSMWVSVQKKQALPSAPVAPRTKCMPGRLVRSGSSGSRMNSGSSRKNPISERKKKISIAGMRSPRCFTSVAITTSVSEPMETSAMPRRTPSMADQRDGGGCVERQLVEECRTARRADVFVLFLHSPEPDGRTWRYSMQIALRIRRFACSVGLLFAPRSGFRNPRPAQRGEGGEHRRCEPGEGHLAARSEFEIAPHPALAALGPPSPRCAGRGSARAAIASCHCTIDHVARFHCQTASSQTAKHHRPCCLKGAGFAFIPFPLEARGVKRRKAPVRNAAPRGPPCGQADPFSGRDRRPMTLGRRASRRSTAAFLLRRRAALSSGHCPGSSASSWQAARSGQPGGAPTPPECEVTSLARRRRTLLHLQMPHESAPR